MSIIGEASIPKGVIIHKSRTIEGHPEETCENCGGPNITWFAPSELWNAVARVEDYEPMLCPICFAKMAEEKGYKPTAWVLSMERI